MNKKQILITVVCSLVFGLIGFYGGRYYEQKTFRNRFQQMRGTNQNRGTFRSGSGNYGRFNPQSGQSGNSINSQNQAPPAPPMD